jgi:hypothetical protein
MNQNVKTLVFPSLPRDYPQFPAFRVVLTRPFGRPCITCHHAQGECVAVRVIAL